MNLLIVSRANVGQCGLKWVIPMRYMGKQSLIIINFHLDFLYVRTNEIVELPYFTKFSNFTQDIDYIYKDITGNDIFTNIYKYSSKIWNFLCEKYFRLIPFSKELQDIAEEIMEEFKKLKVLIIDNYTNDVVTKLCFKFRISHHLNIY